MSARASDDGGMIPGADWSMSLSSATSLSQAKLLAHLGGNLRAIYADIIQAEVPEHLTQIVNRLESKPTATES